MPAPLSARQRYADKLVMSVTEAAAVLDISRQTIYQMIKRGEIRAFKVGSRTRLNAVEVLALIGETPANFDAS